MMMRSRARQAIEPEVVHYVDAGRWVSRQRKKFTKLNTALCFDLKPDICGKAPLLLFWLLVFLKVNKKKPALQPTHCYLG